MSKKLTEMSLEELWQLFPIILTEHQECWKEWYLEEETLLKKVLPILKSVSLLVRLIFFAYYRVF